jgi:hypothetical protein
MTTTHTARGRLAAAFAAALLAVGACSAPVAEADDALRRDLDAAQATAAVADGGTTRTQFVSPLELGRAPEPAAPAAAPVRTAARRTAAPAVRAPAARAVARRPAPRPAAPPAEVADARVAEREDATPPVAPPVAPAVDPAPAEPVVAAPSRRPAPTPEPRRRGGWTTADVIRNAPFPINP